MLILKKKCILCEEPHYFWQKFCLNCRNLFIVLQNNLGKMGLSQLMDELIATGVPKSLILKFLSADPHHTGSLMDQILSQLTNNLAEGIGVKGQEMSAEDVRRIRINPTYGASTKPLND